MTRLFFAALAVLAAGTAAAQTEPSTSTAPRQLAGHWIVAATESAPFAPTARPGEAMRRGNLIFRQGELAGTAPLRCEPARYQALQMPPEGLFEGGLAGPDAAKTATRLGFAAPVPTLRVTCPNASFDFHLTADGERLKIALDGVIYSFERR